MAQPPFLFEAYLLCDLCESFEAASPSRSLPLVLQLSMLLVYHFFQLELRVYFTRI